MLYLLISGSREGFPTAVYEEVFKLLPLNEKIICYHGQAQGVDQELSSYLLDLISNSGQGKIEFKVFPYPTHLGKRGGPVRNQEMIDDLMRTINLSNSGEDKVLGIFLPAWDPLKNNFSRGTEDCWRRIVQTPFYWIKRHPLTGQWMTKGN